MALSATLAVGCGETVISIVDGRGAGAAGTGSAGAGSAGAGSAGEGSAGGAASAGSSGSAAGGASEAGSDGSGAGGASDECPGDPVSVEPCPCGPGVPVTNLCLAHHYPFEGTGTAVVDVVGGADGLVVNTTLSGGAVVLAGATTDQYVELPPGVISAFTHVTVEVWTTWNGTPGSWQRLLDFGNSDAGAGLQGGLGETYLFVTPRDRDGVLKAAFSLGGPGRENIVQGGAPLSAGTLEHLAVVMDGAASLLSLYSNGVLVGSSGPLRGALQDLNDENCWLGRSQSALDVEYAGVIHDLRIFRVARTAEQIAESFAAGPDLLPAR